MLVKVFYNLFLKWYRELIIHFFFPITEWSHCSFFSLTFHWISLSVLFSSYMNECSLVGCFFCDDNDDKPEWSEFCSTSSSIYKHDLLFTINFFVVVLFLNAVLCFLLLTLSCLSCVHLHSDNSIEKFKNKPLFWWIIIQLMSMAE